MARASNMTVIGNVPIPPNFYKHLTTVPGAGEIIDKIFWDSQSYPLAGIASLDFFQVTNVNPIISNMEVNGAIAGDKIFLIRSIGIGLWTNAASQVALADATYLINRGVARLFIGNKDYSEWPLHQLSEGGGVFGASFTNTLATTLINSNNGMPDPRCSYTLTRPLLIPRQLNFRVRIEWPAAAAVTAATMVRVMLKGEIGRQVQ